MVFDYSETEEGKFKPILEVNLFPLNDEEEPFPMRLLVDSGSDMTILDKRFASMLGVDLDQCVQGEMAWGVGPRKPMPTWQAEVRIQVFKGEEKKRRIKSNVAFAKIGDSMGILGQKGFFEYHKITFDHRNKKFYIDEFGD